MTTDATKRAPARWLERAITALSIVAARVFVTSASAYLFNPTPDVAVQRTRVPLRLQNVDWAKNRQTLVIARQAGCPSATKACLLQEPDPLESRVPSNRRRSTCEGRWRGAFEVVESRHRRHGAGRLQEAPYPRTSVTHSDRRQGNVNVSGWDPLRRPRMGLSSRTFGAGTRRAAALDCLDETMDGVSRWKLQHSRRRWRIVRRELRIPGI